MNGKYWFRLKTLKKISKSGGTLFFMYILPSSIPYNDCKVKVEEGGGGGEQGQPTSFFSGLQCRGIGGIFHSGHFIHKLKKMIFYRCTLHTVNNKQGKEVATSLQEHDQC